MFSQLHLKYLTFLLLILAIACSRKPSGVFLASELPKKPDYADPDSWAALPTKKDSADLFPSSLENRQDTAKVDVFFLYPTSFTGKADDHEWNAAIDEENINLKTDRTSIKFQASIFNGVARVFAPRYRQAHLNSFFTKDHKRDGENALRIAYEDVRAAFKYYLDYYNDGRPIIIAGHSQGGLHGRTLLEEFFDTTELKDKLVAAYLVGYPVYRDQYENIPVCETADQTGCFCSWRTYKQGYELERSKDLDKIAVVNPITFTNKEGWVPKDKNQGAILFDLDKIMVGNVGAEIHNGILWSSKPKFKGSWLYWTKNYHPGDFNLFYMNVRENVATRVKEYLSNHP
jgi:hypothetical protein